MIKVGILPPEKWWKKARYQLLEPIDIGKYSIPEGFITDGATVPRFLWPLFPPIGRYLEATIVHDYLLTKRSRLEADKGFKEAMVELNIERWRVVLMYRSVRLFSYYRALSSWLFCL